MLEELLGVKVPKRLIWGVLLLILLIIGFSTMNGTVPANSIGVVYNAFNGGTQNTVLREGVRIKSPLDQVYIISTQVQETNLEKVTSQVKTGQYIDTTANIKWRVNPDNAMIVFKNYKNLENVSKGVIGNLAQKAIEEVTTQYTLDEIMGAKRAEVNTKIAEKLKDAFDDEGIEYHNYVTIDMDAGEAYENALRNEAVKAKEAETAKHEIEKAKAEGEAEVAKVKAQTAKIEEEAKQKQIQAEAEAKANQTLSASITDGLIRLKEQEARLKHGWIEIITSGNVNTQR